MSKIFKGNNSDFNKTAFLNWRTNSHSNIHNMIVLAEGFMSSSIELCEICLRDNKDKKADMLIFPILFNANHGIELYLKSLIWTLNLLLFQNHKIEGKHNIKQIMDTVRAKIKSYKGNDALHNFDNSTSELKNYIAELISLIKPKQNLDNMDFPRYPINKKYENHFYIDELGNVEVDLENFFNIFSLIKDNLDSITSYYYHQELCGEW